MTSIAMIVRRLLVRAARPRPVGRPGYRLGWGFEPLEDRATPDVKVYTGPDLATLVNTYTGTGALVAAVAAPTTLDGYVLVADTAGTDTYAAPTAVTKSLTVLGPNAAVDPNTGTRAAEVHVDTTGGPLSVADGKTLVVRGLAFDVAGGKGAVTVFGTGYAVDFSYNVVANQLPVYRDVYVDSNGGPGYTAATIAHNRIDKTGDPNHAAVMLGTGSNGLVSDNVLLGGFTGVQLNSDLAAGTNRPVVTNNYISGTAREAVQVLNNVNDAVVTFNTVVDGNTQNLPQFGAIFIGTSGGGSVGPGGTLTVSNNLIAGSNNGIVFGDKSYPVSLTALTISQNAVGVNPGTAQYLTGTVADGPGPLDLTGNYFGTTDPAAIAAAIPGARPAVVRAYLSGAANARAGALSPASGAWGFQPDPAGVEMIVPLTAATSGLAVVDGRVQAGVDRATPGMTVRLAGDAYPEAVVTARDVTLATPAAGPFPAVQSLTVAGGTTLLTGTFAPTTGPLTVAGGTVGGTGTYPGPVTVAAGGTLNPGMGGTAVGTLTVGGLTFDGGTLAADFSGSTADRVVVTGPVDLNGGTPGAFVIASQAGVAAPGTVFTLIQNTGANPIADPPLAGAAEGRVVTVNGVPAVVSYTGGNGRSLTLANPSTNLVGVPQFAVGPGVGGGPIAAEYNPDGTQLSSRFMFDPAFRGGIRAAVGDVTGDGMPDVIAGTGPGIAGQVTVRDGATGNVIFTATPFETTFTGGVLVAAADVTGDGVADLIVSAGEGGGPRVVVYRGQGLVPVADFFGLADPNFRGGVRAAGGDLTADGFADLVVVAGPGGGPRVSVYDGKSLAQGQFVHPVPDFFALAPGVLTGLYVAVGDVNRDGVGDVVIGSGEGAVPEVSVLNGQLLVAQGGPAATVPTALIARFTVGADQGGARVAVKNLDGDQYADVIVGAGPGGRVRGYLGKDLTAGTVQPDLDLAAFPDFTGGTAFVG